MTKKLDIMALETFVELMLHGMSPTAAYASARVWLLAKLGGADAAAVVAASAAEGTLRLPRYEREVIEFAQRARAQAGDDAYLQAYVEGEDGEEELIIYSDDGEIGRMRAHID